MFKRILVPLDGSKLAEAALKQACHLAKLTDAELILVRATILPTIPMGTVPIDITELRENERRGVAQYLEQAAERAKAEGVKKIETVVVDNEAAIAIIDTAEKYEVDLIVMSTHGRTGLNRWLFGSVAEKVLRHSNRALYIVRSTTPAS